jgi:hypothetical protein
MPTVAGRPEPSEYVPYYERYVSRVPEPDVLAALAADRSATIELLGSIPESKADHRYEPGKWSIREVLQHMVDTERVFGFRAAWFARSPGSSLPGFEQDDFVRTAPPKTTLSTLVSEFDHLRQGHVLFLSALEPNAWTRSGVASGSPVTVRALAAILAGHSRHHAAVLRERYGV